MTRDQMDFFRAGLTDGNDYNIIYARKAITREIDIHGIRKIVKQL